MPARLRKRDSLNSAWNSISCLGNIRTLKFSYTATCQLLILHHDRHTFNCGLAAALRSDSEVSPKTWSPGTQVKGRALSKDEKEQVDIAQRVLDCLERDVDVRWADPHPRHANLPSITCPHVTYMRRDCSWVRARHIVQGVSFAGPELWGFPGIALEADMQCLRGSASFQNIRSLVCTQPRLVGCVSGMQRIKIITV